MRLSIFVGLLLVVVIDISCAPSADFNNRLNSIVKPYIFSIAGWEIETLINELNRGNLRSYDRIDEEFQTVTEHFSYMERIKELRTEIQSGGRGDTGLDSVEVELNELERQKKALAGSVEKIIEVQIRDSLTQHGIFNPIVDLKVSFPPVDFKLEKTPYLLVISPRERIESIKEVTLKPTLTLKEMNNIEARVDELDVSSLVVALGGLGATFPTLVSGEDDLQSTIDAAIEEWLHQYIGFKPLGFLYLLHITGLSRNYEIANLNETLASMVSKEISSSLYQKYYSEYELVNGHNQKMGSEIEFDQQMKEIRNMVDIYLAQGQVRTAEEFMEERSHYLASIGYHIRKLNQAYFAFYGIYNDSPASVSSIGPDLKKLREQSASLKDFINRVAAMTSYQELRETAK
ncbi:hypothetical protein ACFLUQ_00220 [Chloroflexota bacterium]